MHQKKEYKDSNDQSESTSKTQMLYEVNLQDSQMDPLSDIMNIQSVLDISNISKCVPQLDGDPLPTTTVNTPNICNSQQDKNDIPKSQPCLTRTSNRIRMTTRSFSKLKAQTPKLYKCIKCDYKTHSTKLLNTHRVENHKKKLEESVFKCSICIYKTTAKRLLTDHYEMMHDQEEQESEDDIDSIDYLLFCDYCHFKTNTKGALNKHIKTKHHWETIENAKSGTKPVKKNNAGKLTKSAIKMYRDSEASIICPICKDSFSNNGDFQDHFSSIHLEPSTDSAVTTKQIHKCPLCSIVVKDEVALLKHGLVAHKDLEDLSTDKGPEISSLGCITEGKPRCYKENKGKKDLLQKAFGDCFCSDAGISDHKCDKSKRTRADFSMNCMYCPFKTKSRQIVREHVIVHHKEQLRPCPHCEYQGIGKIQLRDHIREKHKIKTLKNFPCTYCSFSADSRKALYKHSLLNHKELLHNCPKCNKIVLTENQLQKHIYEHNSTRKPKKAGQLPRFTHQCEFCNFTDKMDKLLEHKLQQHMDKVQTHNCPTCAFESYEEAKLKGHIIMEHLKHSKLVDGLICCPHCNFTTTYYIKLKKHYRRCHRDLKPVRKLMYRCEVENCNYTNENLKTYNSHKYDAHGIKPLHSCWEFGCEFVGKNRLDIRTHLESVHNLPMKIEKHEFASESDYIDWIRSIETETCSRYIQHSMEFNCISYVCNRSGRHYIPQNTREKGLKKKQSHTSAKSGITCTSVITGKRLPDGHFTVEACLTHYGHELSAEVLNLAHNERKFLEDKLLAGKSYAKIISEIRNDLQSKPNVKLQRLHLVTKNYLQCLKIKLRKKNMNVPNVTSKKKEIANAKQSFDKVLANRIEQKLSALKAYTSDLSSSNLIEIDKKLSALDELVGGLPGIDKVSSTEEKDEIEDSSDFEKKKTRKRKKPIKKVSHKSPKPAYVEAHSSEELCIDHGLQPNLRQQFPEYHSNRHPYIDLPQSQIVHHLSQPSQGYTPNFEEFGHFM